MEDRCDHCDQNPASHVCASCQAVVYCGKSCQSAHWAQEHEAVCFNVNRPDMAHLTSLIGAEASRDDLMKEVHEALIESPNDPELQEIAVMLGQYLVGETAAQKAARYAAMKAKGPQVSKKTGWKGKLQNKYFVEKDRLKRAVLRGQGKNKSWSEKKAEVAQVPPAVPSHDDIVPSNLTLTQEETQHILNRRQGTVTSASSIKNKLYF